jgi:hypothetical protein
MLYCLSLIFLMINWGCERPEKNPELEKTQMMLDNSVSSVERIIIDKSTNIQDKQVKLESLLKSIDSLQENWTDQMDSIRDILSDQELKQLENESRDRMLKMEELIKKEMPEYSGIFINN